MMSMNFPTHVLSTLVVLSGLLWGNVLYGNDSPPVNAQDCISRFSQNVDVVRQRYAEFGQCDLIETSDKSPGPARLEWFVDTVGGKTSYQESIWKYTGSTPLPEGIWERRFITDGAIYYSNRRRSQPLKQIELTGTPDEVKAKRKQIISNNAYPIPNVFLLTVFHNSVFKIGTSTDDSVADVFLGRLKLLNSRSDEKGVYGTWVTPPNRNDAPTLIEIDFLKSNGYMPSIVRGFFLDATLNNADPNELSKLKRTAWYTVESKWTKFGEGEELFAPSEVVNTQFRFNTKSGNGREMLIVTEWQKPTGPDTELTIENINQEIAIPGKLSALRESLRSAHQRRLSVTKQDEKR